MARSVEVFGGASEVQEVLESCHTKCGGAGSGIVKGWDQVFKDLGTKKFHQEVGGEIPASEMAEDFKKRLLQSQENILSLNDTDIEVSGTSVNFNNSFDEELDAGIVGSFRKIAFD